MTIHRLYLAGPDVFRPDAAEHGRRLVALCADHGFEGVFPLAAALPDGLAPRELAAHIYRANIAHIAACDAVVANLGTSGAISTSTLQRPVVIFVWGQQGLFGGANLEGQKITELASGA